MKCKGKELYILNSIAIYYTMMWERYLAHTEGDQKCKHFYTGNLRGRQNTEYLGKGKVIPLQARCGPEGG